MHIEWLNEREYFHVVPSSSESLGMFLVHLKRSDLLGVVIPH